MITSTKKIKNGSLYFNVVSDRVERAVGPLNGQRLWTQHHKLPLKATPVNRLRLASNKEVGNYKTKTIDHQFPPLPKLPSCPPPNVSSVAS